jgi:hypothetical protein
VCLPSPREKTKQTIRHRENPPPQVITTKSRNAKKEKKERKQKTKTRFPFSHFFAIDSFSPALVTHAGPIIHAMPSHERRKKFPIRIDSPYARGPLFPPKEIPKFRERKKKGKKQKISSPHWKRKELRGAVNH